MERRTILSRKNHTVGRSAREGGWSLIELTVTLALLMAIALFGIKTMGSAFMLQNWSIAQSMTDAYAGIETAYAQRYVFDDITTGGPSGVKRWAPYPAVTTTNGVTIGQTPSGQVTATVIRTYHTYTDPVTGALSYLLESYIVYQDGQRKYCKVSKVYRSE
jgi:hypothetical protein